MTLISRLEAATGPDRELDICIWRAASGFSGRGTKDIRGAHFEAEANGVPAYTGSLDAAMTLVRPEDDIDSYKLLCDCGCWFISFRSVIGFNGEVKTFTEGGTENVALEFCTQYFRHIAALKARV